MSNLLRGAAVAELSGRPMSISQPRVFGGARVLRSDQVGVDRPISLSVPVSVAAVLAQQAADELALVEETPPPPPPPDFTQLAEAARLQGHAEGYEQGRAEGMAAAEAAMAGAIRRLQAIVNNVQESHTSFYRAAERQVVDLSIQIAQKVIEREIENMPDLAVGVIRAALEEMDVRTAVRVRVNPDDEELLRRRWSLVVPPGISPDRIELLADERVKGGGAVIDTTSGQVDAQLESKLEQLGNALWTFVMEVSSTESADA